MGETMSTGRHPEVIDLVGQGGDIVGVGRTMPAGVGDRATSGIRGAAAPVGVRNVIGIGSGTVGGITGTGEGGVSVRMGSGMGNTTPYGVPIRGEMVTGGAGMFAELREFDMRCFSTVGGPLPEATKQVREQYQDLGNMLHDMNERKLEYLEHRVNQQGDMLLGYQQQLQTERQESQSQLSEYEQSANEKLLSLQRQLDNETRLTRNLKNQIIILRASKRFHVNINKNQSDIIAEREREISVMRNERDLMETEKKAAENKVKELLAEIGQLKSKVGDSSGNSVEEMLATGQNEKQDSVASGSSGLRTPRVRRGTWINGGIGAMRPSGSGRGSSRRRGRNTGRVAANSADPNARRSG